MNSNSLPAVFGAPPGMRIGSNLVPSSRMSDGMSVARISCPGASTTIDSIRLRN